MRESTQGESFPTLAVSSHGDRSHASRYTTIAKVLEFLRVESIWSLPLVVCKLSHLSSTYGYLVVSLPHEMTLFLPSLCLSYCPFLLSFPCIPSTPSRMCTHEQNQPPPPPPTSTIPIPISSLPSTAFLTSRSKAQIHPISPATRLQIFTSFPSPSV